MGLVMPKLIAMKLQAFVVELLSLAIPALRIFNVVLWAPMIYPIDASPVIAPKDVALVQQDFNVRKVPVSP